MKVIGIIAEYNPFHYGHLYQIKKIKELYPDSLIIAVISTSFTQRGDVSLLNKWDKAKICLENDILFCVRNEIEIHPGDEIEVYKVGAYTMSQTPNFIRMIPAVYCKDNNLEIRRKWLAENYVQGCNYS